MDIRYVTRNIEMPDEIRSLMDKKLEKLEKFFDRILDTQVEVHHSRGMFVVEITSNVNGVIMRGEDYAPDMRKAFEKALKNIERQVKRHKDYLRDRSHLKKGIPEISFDLESTLPLGEDSASVGKEEIVKIKRFPVRPMSPEEATMQMDLLGHTFFVFRNSDNGEINVVYRRREGNFRLLQPEK
jgi:putative sigma-54 modulation protein